METRYKVQPYEINVYCEDCSKKPNPGCILIRQPYYLPCFPPLYVYRCPLCNKQYKLEKLYPTIVYEINEND